MKFLCKKQFLLKCTFIETLNPTKASCKVKIEKKINILRHLHRTTVDNNKKKMNDVLFAEFSFFHKSNI